MILPQLNLSAQLKSNSFAGKGYCDRAFKGAGGALPAANLIQVQETERSELPCALTL